MPGLLQLHCGIEDFGHMGVSVIDPCKA